MIVTSLAIPDVKILTPRVFRDARGHFCETWKKTELATAGIEAEFVQDNQAMSHAVGTLRGLHFQLPPRAQDKLVRVTRGSILDVAVDIRRQSPTFGQHVSAVISAENWAQIWVPKASPTAMSRWNRIPRFSTRRRTIIPPRTIGACHGTTPRSQLRGGCPKWTSSCRRRTQAFHPWRHLNRRSETGLRSSSLAPREEGFKGRPRFG